MGALPSRESHESPFSLHIAHNGSCSLTMVPVTPHFFPSPQSLAFRQLYECRDRQSVKYSFPLLSSSYELEQVTREQEAVLGKNVASNPPSPHTDAASTPPTVVTADNFAQLFGDPLRYEPCPEDMEPDPFLQYGVARKPRGAAASMEPTSSKPQYKTLEDTYDAVVVQPTANCVVDTNAEMCELFRSEQRWREARAVVRAQRRSSRPPENADALAAAQRVPPPPVFLRPLSQVIVFRMSRDDEVAARAAYAQTRRAHDDDDVAPQGGTEGESSYRFAHDPHYRDGRLHLVEEDGVLYLFAYNPNYVAAAKQSADATSSSSPTAPPASETAPANAQTSRSRSASTPDEDDEAGRRTGSEVWAMQPDCDGPFLLPITPVRVVGYNGLLESHCRGTPWLRGVDDDADEDAYMEHKVQPKPPVLRAYSFIDAAIGDKILSRAYLLVVQTYRRLCLDAGLPDSLVRPMWVMKLLANVPWLQLCRELRLRMQAAVKDIALHTRAPDTATAPSQPLAALLTSMGDSNAAAVRQWMRDPQHYNDYGALFAIRGSRLLVRLRPDALLLFLTLSSLTTAPLSAAHFKKPIDTAAYDYGGTVSLHELRDGATGGVTHQVLGLPRNPQAVLENAALRRQRPSGTEVVNGRRRVAAVPTLVYTVTEVSSTAAGPSVQCGSRPADAPTPPTVDHDNNDGDGGTMANAELALARLRQRHGFLYPPNTFVDGDLVTYNVSAGCWEHLWHGTREVAAQEVVPGCVRLEQVLLCWVKTQLHAASMRLRTDPGWLRDEQHNIVQEGRYFIWTVEHDQQRFYYGLIPKFAREKRKSKRLLTMKQARRAALTSRQRFQHPRQPVSAPQLIGGEHAVLGGVTRGGVNGVRVGAAVAERGRPYAVAAYGRGAPSFAHRGGTVAVYGGNPTVPPPPLLMLPPQRGTFAVPPAWHPPQPTAPPPPPMLLAPPHTRPTQSFYSAPSARDDMAGRRGGWQGGQGPYVARGAMVTPMQRTGPPSHGYFKSPHHTFAPYTAPAGVVNVGAVPPATMGFAPRPGMAGAASYTGPVATAPPQRPTSIHIPLHVDPQVGPPMMTAAVTSPPTRWSAAPEPSSAPPAVAQGWQRSGSTTAPPAPRSHTLAGYERRGMGGVMGTASVMGQGVESTGYVRPSPVTAPAVGYGAPHQPPPSPLLPYAQQPPHVVPRGGGQAWVPQRARPESGAVGVGRGTGGGMSVQLPVSQPPRTITTTPVRLSHEAGQGGTQTSVSSQHRFTWNPYGG